MSQSDFSFKKDIFDSGWNIAGDKHAEHLFCQKMEETINLLMEEKKYKLNLDFADLYDGKIKTFSAQIDIVNDKGNTEAAMSLVFHNEYIYLSRIDGGKGLGKLLICLILCLNPDPENISRVELTAVSGEAEMKKRNERRVQEGKKTPVDHQSLVTYYENLGFEKEGETEVDGTVSSTNMWAHFSDLVENCMPK